MKQCMFIQIIPAEQNDMEKKNQHNTDMQEKGLQTFSNKMWMPFSRVCKQKKDMQFME